jgi:hypothetical protein
MASQFINPLSMIGQSTNQPDVAGTNKALRDLQTRHLLTEMQQTGAAERSTASDLSRLRGVTAGIGLTPETLTPEYLDPIRGQIAAVRGGEAISSAASGGVRFPKGSPSFALPDVWKQTAEPGHPLKAESAALATAKFTTGQQEGAKFKGVRRLPDGKFEEYEYFRKHDQTGQSKNDPRIQKYVDELHKRIAGKYGGNPVIMGETKTHLSVSFDGKNPVRIRKDPTKTK